MEPIWAIILQYFLCFVVLQVAKCFVSVQIFWVGPKKLTAFSASSRTFVLAQTTILLNANHLFAWHKMFMTGTICK